MKTSIILIILVFSTTALANSVKLNVEAGIAVCRETCKYVVEIKELVTIDLKSNNGNELGLKKFEREYEGKKYQFVVALTKEKTNYGVGLTVNTDAGKLSPFSQQSYAYAEYKELGDLKPLVVQGGSLYTKQSENKPTPFLKISPGI